MKAKTRLQRINNKTARAVRRLGVKGNSFNSLLRIMLDVIRYAGADNRVRERCWKGMKRGGMG